MNYSVYIDGIYLPRVDAMLTTDGYLRLREAPTFGAQIVIQVLNGWNQGFVGDGATNQFALSPRIQQSMSEDSEVLKCKQILYDAMHHADNPIVQTEIERLATVIALAREYQ
jgi:hypothetical protein